MANDTLCLTYCNPNDNSEGLCFSVVSDANPCDQHGYAIVLGREDYDAIFSSIPSEPVDLATAAQAYGAGFTIAAIPTLMIVSVVFLLRMIRNR